MKEPDDYSQLQESVDEGPSRCARLCTCFGRPLLDALLLSVSIVLLITVGLLLRGNPSVEVPELGTQDMGLGDTSRRLMLSLGMALFLVSLLVCMYAMTRLGFCCGGRHHSHRRLRSGIPSVNSSVQLMPATDLPPTYETVVFSRSDSQPPSYYAITFLSENLSNARGARPVDVG